MTRLEALKVLMVYLAFEYALNEAPAYKTFCDMLEESTDPKLSEAMLVWFGSTKPHQSTIELFLKVWWDVIQVEIFPQIPQIMLGTVTLTEIITETIL